MNERMIPGYYRSRI